MSITVDCGRYIWTCLISVYIWDITCLLLAYHLHEHYRSTEAGIHYVLKPRIREGSSGEGNILHDGHKMGNKN